MKPNELRDMSVEDLQNRLGELTEERFRLRFRSATESIENPMRFRAIRREIARIHTILKEKVAASSESPVLGGE
ncbi:MAG TPA: 50S ribosomal protein L29 [Gemmatimonadales bacterium]|nr:50S ribosomal protein L29 [Gemmatimonadales bacterium]